MSDYVNQLEEAMRQALAAWVNVYPTAWPVLDVLGNSPQAFIGDGGRILKPWYAGMTPEWVAYAHGRLAALTPAFYTADQITGAIRAARESYPLLIHAFFAKGEKSRLLVGKAICEAADLYFPEQARACSIPLVKLEI